MPQRLVWGRQTDLLSVFILFGIVMTNISNVLDGGGSSSKGGGDSH